MQYTSDFIARLKAIDPDNIYGRLLAYLEAYVATQEGVDALRQALLPAASQVLDFTLPRDVAVRTQLRRDGTPIWFLVKYDNQGDRSPSVLEDSEFGHPELYTPEYLAAARKRLVATLDAADRAAADQ
jgi:hypothetical protein